MIDLQRLEAFLQSPTKNADDLPIQPLRFILIWAASNNRSDIVKLSAQHGVDLEAHDAHRRTALSWAAAQGHQDVVSTLLELSVDTEARDGYGRTPLWWAAANGQVASLQRLLKHGADSECPDLHEQRALSRAAGGGHIDAVEVLLGQEGVLVDAEDGCGRTALSWAAGNGHAHVVSTLLRKGGASLGARDIRGRCALLWAATNGRTAALATLLEGGADRQSCDDQERTAVALAARNGHRKTIQLLLRGQRHPDVVALLDARDSRGRSPLCWAAEMGHLDAVQALVGKAMKLERRANMEFLRRSDVTPLGWALEFGIKEQARSIFANFGLDLDLSDDGSTPLLLAARNGHSAVVKYLLSCGAEVDVRDSKGRTPLWWAAANSHVETLQVLLNLGRADAALQDWNGETALSRAAYSRNDIILKLLDGTSVSSTEAFPMPHREALLPWAIIGGHDGLVGLLLLDGVNPNGSSVQKPYGWNSPLGVAAKDGHREIVQMLVDSGADIDAGPPGHYRTSTPLLIAVRRGHAPVVEYLLAKGANKHSLYMNAKGQALYREYINRGPCLYPFSLDFPDSDPKDSEPLWVATINGCYEVANCLIEHYLSNLEHQADRRKPSSSNLVNRQDWTGRTLLCYAAEVGYESAVRRLVSMPCVQTDLAAYGGKTPLILAAMNGHRTIVELLIESKAELALEDFHRYSFSPKVAMMNQGLAVYLIDKAILSIESGADARWCRRIRALLVFSACTGLESQLRWALSRLSSQADQTPSLNLLPAIVEAVDAAARNGQHRTVEILLTHDGVDSTEGKAMLTKANLLEYPCLRDHEAVVKILLSHGIGPSSDSTRAQPLDHAASSGHLGIMKLLLLHGADPDSKSADGNMSDKFHTPLCLAAEKGHLDAVKMLLAQGADPNRSQVCSPRPQLPLCVAATTGNKAIVETLLNRGALLMARETPSNWNALRYAVRHNHRELVQFFLEAGLSISDDPIHFGLNPSALEDATKADNADIVKLLLNYGAGGMHEGFPGSLMCLAASAGSQKVVQFLIESGVDVESTDSHGRTALAVSKSKDMTALLLGNGADPNKNIGWGAGALNCGVRSGEADVVKLLLDAGADPNQGSPLAVAVWEISRNHTEGIVGAVPRAGANTVDIVEALLKAGANTEVEDEGGFTPLAWAAWKGNKEAVKLLLRNGASPNSFAGRQRRRKLERWQIYASSSTTSDSDIGQTAD